jgi:hypothetical protein
VQSLPYIGAHLWDKASGRDRVMVHGCMGSTEAGANGKGTCQLRCTRRDYDWRGCLGDHTVGVGHFWVTACLREGGGVPHGDRAWQTVTRHTRWQG